MDMYRTSGTVFFRNEFMKGHQDYERSWEFSHETYMAETIGEAIHKVLSAHLQGPVHMEGSIYVHEDQYGRVEIRNLQVENLGELMTRGTISLQTGKPYNCTTIRSVLARNIRSAEDEGFIPRRGAMRCEVTYLGQTWHAKKHDENAEWFLDGKVGEEPETRKRGRIALEADQTPDLALYE